MFELDPKLEGEKIVVTWEPDADFFDEGVTFLFDSNLAVTVENYKDAKYNRIQDPDPEAMLVGSPQLSPDNLKMNQIIEGGIKGAKYLLKFFANLTDGTQRVGVQAVIEVI